jgi:hypothetical protein
MTITQADIRVDINEYERRLSKLRDRLDAMPHGGHVRKLRGRLQREIEHVQGLLRMAQEAL